MLSDIFKTACDKYILNLGNFLVVTLLLYISYLILLKLSLFGGEIIRPFFLAGMLYITFFFNKKAEVNFFFYAFKNKNLALKIFLYTILRWFFIVLGTIFFVLPGIYIAFSTIFALPFIVMEPDIDVFDAFKKSIQMFNQNFLLVLSIIGILIFINIITAFPYGLFSIFTIPFSICIIGVTFQKLYTGDAYVK